MAFQALHFNGSIVGPSSLHTHANKQKKYLCLFFLLLLSQSFCILLYVAEENEAPKNNEHKQSCKAQHPPLSNGLHVELFV